MSSAEFHTKEQSSTTGRNSSNISPFDELAGEYDSWFDKEGSLIFSIEVQAFETLLPSLPRPWLEIGVGSGRFARALGIATGVDPSISLVKMARQRGINVFLGRGEQDLFGEESLGTVFLIVTLCFLDSPLDVLREANRILMPGGNIVLGLVLQESPWGRFYRRKQAEGHRFYRYARFYSYEEAIKLLAEAGFENGRVISTLFQRPGEVLRKEEPREGYSPDAGFTIITGLKPGG